MERIIKNILYVMIASVVVVNSLVCMKPQSEWSSKGLSTMGSSTSQPIRQYKLSAAGVLPIIYNDDHNQMVAILGKQTAADTVNAGKYDYFAGIADKEDKGDSVATAAREWWEESRLEKILGWSLKTTQQFIKNNVKGYTILATHYYVKQEDKRINEKNTYGVMYLVDVSEIQNKLFEEFEPSYQNVLELQKNSTVKLTAFLEKDKVAAITWNDLLSWVKPKHGNLKNLMPIRMSGNGQVPEKGIELRPILTVLLKGMTKKNMFAELSESLPLGIFIFATEKQEGSKDFAQSQLLLAEKKNLNDMVKIHLPNPSMTALAKKIQSLKRQGALQENTPTGQKSQPEAVSLPVVNSPQLPVASQVQMQPVSQSNIPVVQPQPISPLPVSPVPQQVKQEPSSGWFSELISASFNAVLDFIKSMWNLFEGSFTG